jgi:protein-L-isoaspartate O-methyltransferase
VIPIGETTQKLVVVENLEEGFKKEEIEPVKFVPLLGGTTR